MSYIYIVPIQTSSELWLESVENGIKHVFGKQTQCLQGRVTLSDTFDYTRSQYNSSKILVQLISNPPADDVKILGITDVDLFIPILTFVFGEAQLRGMGAVVSLHRLNNKFYGMQEDSALLVNRLVKESIHELGHTFGLLHCSQPDCVMRPSTYAEDIDQKSIEPCVHCRRLLSVR
jgi:archaemetzincin